MAYVDRVRALPDPRLRTTLVREPRREVPQDRYAMADGCYTLQAPSGTYVVRDGSEVAVAPVPARRAAPFFFKATRLGGYLLHTADGELAGRGSQARIAAQPSAAADWTVRRQAGRFVLQLPDGALRASAGALGLAATPTRFALRRTSGCAGYPEAQVNVAGRPHAGTTDFQEVRGYVDAHTHGMAFEFLGGKVHCGRPWHSYGAPYALKDCPDHTLTGGNGALLEAVLSGIPRHDPVGWPTFKDWPAPESLTHEGTYWKWLERSWRGGQRLFVNLLVENNQLCQIYPLKRNSCDDMDSIRLQARDMYAMQDYIDAQYGGPGKGFYRIVTDPYQARRVINAGKMAVVMGVETSIPFGCTFKNIAGRDIPACDAAEIDSSLDELHRMGVRQMELVNKFDNALAGVAGDAGATGVVVNLANFLETGSFWRMEHCEPADGESADRTQVGLPDISAGQQDALFGAIGKLFGDLLPALPLYGTPLHCNKRGLTDLGVHTIGSLADRRIIFDPDHLSVKARKASMDVIDDLDYPGVISSHSWSTPDTYPRIYAGGGFITPYAGDSTGFVEKWRRHQEWADPHYYFGFGFGADINGLGAQGNPRGADVPNPVTYPFTGLNGVRISQQKAGQRTWDINVDGVAQYGLYPDWIEDLRRIAESDRRGDGAKIVDDMARGAEAYLQMWERTYGVAPDSCRNPDRRRRPSVIRQRVRPGMTDEQVLRAVGQPWQRLGTTYTICARTKKKARVPMKIRFSAAGRVVQVTGA
ncbi:hypothetical protein FXB39_12070 [Nocardioides sp. BGMRC 2183]|nr:hypothetical protein FXB39_12070 [Nocardioides sp. BGMRC 2183]